MGSPYWVKKLLNSTFSQRFFWAKLSNYKGFGRLMEYFLFEGDDIIYLPKDTSIPVNTPLDTKEDMVVPSDILKHFIKSSRYHFIMDFCICRDSTKCRDYPIGLGCLFLGEAVKGINPKFGRMVSEEEALEHVKKCREAGLVHLIGRNKLDTVWLNIKPGEKLLTVCNCCPCCCLWKVLPVINPSISSKVNKMPGVSVEITEKCVGCGNCTKNVCFVDAIRLEGERALINQNCRGCGRCVDVCPKGAISINIMQSDAVEASINKIAALVDLQ